MPQAPNIVVQLIHIQGPLKGEIQEFSDPEITIGRHPSCHLQFPEDLAIISRNHARIIREGNRHKLIDESTNGTFVNGKPITEVYLKSGDVLTFAEEGGPKVSFVTEMKQAEPTPPPKPAPPRPIETPPTPNHQEQEEQKPPEPTPTPIKKRPKPTPEPIKSEELKLEKDSVQETPPPADIPIERVKMPLAIQYGPTLRAYKELPITIGRKPDCDFTLEHPAILDRHAQIFFSGDSYGIKDLTGKAMITVNNQPINLHTFLSGGDRIHLSPQGPKFQFMAGGRLAEVEEESPTPNEAPESRQSEEPSESETTDKKKSMFNKLFQR
ncbi:MAG: FHA domain-containing protein [Thermodesulfobacteriota bacterium]